MRRLNKIKQYKYKATMKKIFLMLALLCTVLQGGMGASQLGCGL